MTTAVIQINGRADRTRAMQLIAKVDAGTMVHFKKAKRSIPQNSLLWVKLTAISRQVEWYGQRLTPDDWKDMFTASLRKARVVPGIDPGSFVLLGLHTSQVDKEEMGNLLDLIDAFAAERNVKFDDEEQAA